MAKKHKSTVKIPKIPNLPICRPKICKDFLGDQERYHHFRYALSPIVYNINTMSEAELYKTLKDGFDLINNNSDIHHILRLYDKNEWPLAVIHYCFMTYDTPLRLSIGGIGGEDCIVLIGPVDEVCRCYVSVNLINIMRWIRQGAKIAL